MATSFLVWGPEQREAFDRDGHVTLKGAFDPEQAAAMARAVWGFVERRTEIREDDPSTWPDGWFGTSLKKLKRHGSFQAVIESVVTRAALDGIFGAEKWSSSRSVLTHVGTPSTTHPHSPKPSSSIHPPTLPASTWFSYFVPPEMDQTSPT